MMNLVRDERSLLISAGRWYRRGVSGEDAVDFELEFTLIAFIFTVWSQTTTRASST